MAKKFNISFLISSLSISICFPCLADTASTQQSTSMQPLTTQTTPTSAAFYVSPSGNDYNNAGTSPARPFATLTKAQSAMQNSSTKTTYLMGGTYTLTSPLTLRNPDLGESWLAYPGQKPILDGNGTTDEAIIIGAHNVTINGLTITNFSRNGIYVENRSNIKITNNIIENINSYGWNQGAILSMNNFRNSTISHNYINNTQYGGIVIVTDTGDDISNLTIDSNIVYNTCISVSNCGAIYANDVNHSSTNIRVTNNLVENYGTREGVGIYLDINLSNSLVSNNIVAGTGTYAVLIHGGDHHSIKNNIFDISQASYLVAYSKYPPNYGMYNNVFSCNIVLSSYPKSKLWLNYASGESLPAVNSNAYSTILSSTATSGQFADTNPTFTNVTLTRNTQNRLSLQSPPPISCFKPIDVSQAGPQL